MKIIENLKCLRTSVILIAQHWLHLTWPKVKSFLGKRTIFLSIDSIMKHGSCPNKRRIVEHCLRLLWFSSDCCWVLLICSGRSKTILCVATRALVKRSSYFLHTCSNPEHLTNFLALHSISEQLCILFAYNSNVALQIRSATITHCKNWKLK